MLNLFSVTFALDSIVGPLVGPCPIIYDTTCTQNQISRWRIYRFVVLCFGGMGVLSFLQTVFRGDGASTLTFRYEP